MIKLTGFVALGVLFIISATLLFRGSDEGDSSVQETSERGIEAGSVEITDQQLERTSDTASGQDVQAVADEPDQEPSEVNPSASGLESVPQDPPLSARQTEQTTDDTRARAQGLGADWPEIEAVSSPESGAMESEILDFLSRRSDLGITSITDVRCDARNCKFQLTGLDQVPVPMLMRELMAEESLALTDARFRFVDATLGFDSIELLISYDAKAVSETQTAAQRVSTI